MPHPGQRARRRRRAVAGHRRRRRASRARRCSFRLLIITLSFIPVFTLEAQEGRLFSPLALHQDLRDGRRRRAGGDADSGADGLPHPRPHPGRKRESR